ncbi:MAG: hypothetical protein QN183_03915 [Armatimonadota bacterium]|nr:hypothetical protein [Armatimonadota bacterium]MDR7484985.1 hypothetical protein [Armatimonadota bacterium]MDR7533714.1 hypothetical protein [Armatimonadota bacterium]MDR7535499.1 hypothetical protein [Armatimonadota bacterium]
MRAVRGSRTGPPRLRAAGFTTFEVLLAAVVVALVVAFTIRVVVATLGLVGSSERDPQHGARARSQATEWIQAAIEYSRAVGFDALRRAPTCAALTALSPCHFWIPPAVDSADRPFDLGPALPSGFDCGHVQLAQWSASPPPGGDLDNLLSLTVEVYRSRTSCDAGGTGQAFMTAQTAIARRQGP